LSAPPSFGGGSSFTQRFPWVIFNGCVDIGNYETKDDYFPIKFKANIPQFVAEKPTKIL